MEQRSKKREGGREVGKKGQKEEGRKDKRKKEKEIFAASGSLHSND